MPTLHAMPCFLCSKPLRQTSMTDPSFSSRVAAGQTFLCTCGLIDRMAAHINFDCCSMVDLLGGESRAAEGEVGRDGRDRPAPLDPLQVLRALPSQSAIASGPAVGNLGGGRAVPSEGENSVAPACSLAITALRDELCSIGAFVLFIFRWLCRDTSCPSFPRCSYYDSIDQSHESLYPSSVSERRSGCVAVHSDMPFAIRPPRSLLAYLLPIYISFHTADDLCCCVSCSSMENLKTSPTTTVA